MTSASFYFCLGVIGLLIWTAWRTKQHSVLSLGVAAGLLIWFSFVAFVGRSGWFATNPLFLPFIAIGFLVLFGLLRWVYHTRPISELFMAIPQPLLIGIQTYRLVGYAFFEQYRLGLLPAAFAFPAGIGDMLVGGLAPIVAILSLSPLSARTGVIRYWNYIGIADLVIALSVGVLGFPRPIQFVPMTPSTEAIALDPLVIVPLFAVPLAFLLHLFSLKGLLNKSN